MKSKKRLFDAAIIILIAFLLIFANCYDFLCDYMHFSVIPLAACYFLGQYSERKFK